MVRDRAISQALADYASRGIAHPLEQAMMKMTDGAADETELATALVLASMIMSNCNEAKAILGEALLNGKLLACNEYEAKQLLSNASEQGSVRATYDLGVYYFLLKEYARAIENFEEALRSGALSDDKSGLCHGTLGESYANLPNPNMQKALEHLTIAADKYHIPNAIARIGELYLQQDSASERRKAIPYLKSAAEQDASAAEKLAELFIYGDEELGIVPSHYEAELLLNKHAHVENEEILFMLGKLNLYGVAGEPMGGYEGATRAINPLEQLWQVNKSPVVANALGLAYYLVGREREALPLWEQADEAGECGFLDFLGRIYVREVNDPERGLDCYDRAFRSDKGLANMFVCSEYIELLMDNGRCSEAFGIASTAEQEYNDIQFPFLKAKLVLEGLYDVDDPYKYVMMMKSCAKYDGYAVEANQVLARYYEGMGNYTEARVPLNKLYALGETDAACRLAAAYPQEPLLAIDWYAKAFESGMIDAAIKIANIYEDKLGNPDKAYEWFQAAAEKGSDEGASQAAKFKKTMFGHYKRIA